MRKVFAGIASALLAVTLMSAPAFAEEVDPSTPPTDEAVDPTTPASPEPAPEPTATEPPATTDPTPTPGPTEPAPDAEPSPPSEPPADELPEDEGPPALTLPDATFEDLGLTTNAVPSQFRPGNLISDYKFYDGWAMTEAEIQRFLDQQIGSCQNTLCLNVYRETTPTRTWSFGTCGTYHGAPNESAARIIFKVQRACNLSAKVILVTLQKEQSLVSAKAPTAGVLRKAMGYGCPDTAACDSTYYGFFNQVFAAGRQLTWYGNPQGSFTHIRVGQVNAIRYHPDAACGAGNVRIENRATAALYYYTPYQPNAAAIGNLYGTGDGCSSYGNRNFWRMYSDWFGDPRLTTPLPVTRHAGVDRYATAAEVSRASFPSSGVPVVYIASGTDFPDALSAAPAAVKQGGPLLLTNPGGTPWATLKEIERLKPARIVIVGGTGAVSNTVASQLRAYAPVTRIAGADRYETSRQIASTVFDGATAAWVATGADYPDALAASAAAGRGGTPVLLVPGSSTSLDAPTRSALSGVTYTVLAGGTGAVSQGIENELTQLGITVNRRAGIDRYETSVRIAEAAYGTVSTGFIGTGLDFPDALTGAAAAPRFAAPLYLTRPTCLSEEVRNDMTLRTVDNVTLLGGHAALTRGIEQLAVC